MLRHRAFVSSKCRASGIEVWGRGLDGSGSRVQGSCGSELRVLVFRALEVRRVEDGL